MTQSEIKFVKSLSLQKYRKEHKAYLIHGNKIVKEWIAANADFLYLIANEDWVKAQGNDLSSFVQEKLRIVPDHVLAKLSQQDTPAPVMAVIKMPPAREPHFDTQDWTIVLDRIQDPGNLGTIIRTADWFGIQEVWLTPHSVELYNPKVIQATMGSFLRVKTAEITLEDLFQNAKKKIWLTAMQGVSVFDTAFTAEEAGYIVLGNESQGVDVSFLEKTKNLLTIPKKGGAESLNVAIANAVICAQLTAKKK